MNYVGRTFIVLIFIFSLVFMSFAVAVYATHKNWREVVENPREAASAQHPVGLLFQLEDAKKQREAFQKEHDEYKKKVEDENVEKRQVLAKAETERESLRQKLAELQKERDELAQRDQKELANLVVAHENLKALTTEVEGLRKTIRDTESDRDDQFKAVVSKTDAVNQAEGELARMKERLPQLAAQLAFYKDWVTKHGFNPAIETPPSVKGKAVAVNGDGMVEFNIGSDDGLQVGNTLEVYRGSKYLARLVVLQLDTDRGVGKIDPKHYLAPIQKGDNVATRLSKSG